MSLTDDVSWPLIERIVKEYLGESAQLAGIGSLHGGSMSTTLLLRLKRHPSMVLKIAPHMVVHQYEQEAYQLNLLRDWGLPTPEVYGCQVGTLDDPNSYLLMEQMPGSPLAEARRELAPEDFSHVEMHLADIVLALHARTSVSYKRVSDGGEDGLRDYVAFFRSIYDPIVHDVIAMKLVPPPLRRRIQAIHDKLPELVQHQDRPRLIHGDLWSSNLLVDRDRQGRWWVSAVLDPNCRYSHAELELAYLELFKTVTPAFFRVYEQAHPLSPEYHQLRRDVYMLYPLLNHVRLFGQQYLRPLSVVAERVAKKIASRRRVTMRV